MHKDSAYLPLGEASGYLPYTVYMATKDYISANPGTIQKFTNATYKGQMWVNSHTSAEIAEVCLPYFEDSNINTLTKIIERYKAQDTWKTNPIVDPDGFELIQDIMEDGGQLNARVPYEKFITTKFADKAVKTIK